MRSRFPYLAAWLAILVCALALNAKRSLTTKLDVTPNPARPGDALAITSSLTNNSNEVETMTISMQMSGPCGVAASKTYKVLLGAHQTDTSKGMFQAPRCVGPYQAVLTVSDERDGVIIGSSTKEFEVTATTGSGAK